MTRTPRAKTKKAGKPFVATRARYENLVHGIGKFAAGSVRILEDEMVALDLSARKSAVRYLRLAMKELRSLEGELKRIEKTIAPETPRRRVRVARRAPVAFASGVAA